MELMVDENSGDKMLKRGLYIEMSFSVVKNEFIGCFLGNAWKQRWQEHKLKFQLSAPPEVDANSVFWRRLYNNV